MYVTTSSDLIQKLYRTRVLLPYLYIFIAVLGTVYCRLSLNICTRVQYDYTAILFIFPPGGWTATLARTRWRRKFQFSSVILFFQIRNNLIYVYHRHGGLINFIGNRESVCGRRNVARHNGAREFMHKYGLKRRSVVVVLRATDFFTSHVTQTKTF